MGRPPFGMGALRSVEKGKDRGSGRPCLWFTAPAGRDFDLETPVDLRAGPGRPETLC